jgi:addiction module HigA family antidote
MPAMSKSLNTTNRKEHVVDVEIPVGGWIPPETCGEILRQDFLEPAGITPYRLAKAIGVPQTYIAKILNGGGISAQMGAKLDRYFVMSNGWWSRMQADYDNRISRRKIADQLDRIEPLNQREA